MTIVVVGDYAPGLRYHPATTDALRDAGADVEWRRTDDIGSLDRFEGIVAAPGGPYTSLDGMLGAIRYAREHDRPFLGL